MTEKAVLTLNKEIYQCSKEQVAALGQIIGLRINPDPNKVSALKDVGVPSNVYDVRHFLGMTNQLNKFVPNLANRTKPLRP